MSRFAGVGHAAHLLLLLSPTWWLAGWAGIDAGLAIFAAAVLFAGILESEAARKNLGENRSTAEDLVAIRVARWVGVGLLLTFWLAQWERLQHPAGWLGPFAGGLLFSAGVFLRVAAIHTLGSRFVSDIRAQGSRVREGVYAWLRHPSECGLLLIATGGPLLAGAPRTALLAGALLAPVSYWRTRREDAAWRSGD